jgi:cytoskeletal protein RodZ
MADIGSTLREARMRARIDISEVEARTKIRAKYLRAIENEEWDLLPGAVYVKSFLRTYGDFLGLDSRLLVDEFKRRYERPDDHEVRPISTIGRERVGRERERPQRRSSRRVSAPTRLTRRIRLSPLAGIVVAVVVIVLGLYEIGSNTNNSNPPSQQAGNTTPTTATKSHKKHHKHHSPKTTTSKQTTTTATNPTPPPPKQATLAMVATSTVWVCEVGEPGNKLLLGGLDYLDGQKIPTQHAREILVSLGNTNVNVTANGKAYPLASGAALGFKVTPKGVYPLTKTPTGCG